MAKLANDWPSANGTITDWKIVQCGGAEGGSTFKLTLQVSIEVKDRAWISSVDTGDDFGSERSAVEFALQLQDGPLLVYFDPGNPSRGSLNRDPLSIAPPS